MRITYLAIRETEGDPGSRRATRFDEGGRGRNGWRMSMVVVVVEEERRGKYIYIYIYIGIGAERRL